MSSEPNDGIRQSPRKKRKTLNEDGSLFGSAADAEAQDQSKPLIEEATPSRKPKSKPPAKPKGRPPGRPKAKPEVQDQAEAQTEAAAKPRGRPPGKPGAKPEVQDQAEAQTEAAAKPKEKPQAKPPPLPLTLKQVAAETLRLLPGLLATRPDVDQHGYLSTVIAKLDPKNCPNLKRTKIRVVNGDTIETALSLPKPTHDAKPVCVLNMANAGTPGGGYHEGSRAQEEAICYCTSLFLTLERKFYPIPQQGGIYSPQVLVFRESMMKQNVLLDLREPKNLSVVSVVSFAALNHPKTTMVNGKTQYAVAADKTLMEEKIRAIIRMCAANGHRQIVLGAFGCGVFANPPEEVAKMFLTTLKQPEFHGWWEDVVFAVLDKDGKNGNFKAFFDELDRKSV